MDEMEEESVAEGIWQEYEITFQFPQQTWWIQESGEKESVV